MSVRLQWSVAVAAVVVVAALLVGVIARASPIPGTGAVRAVLGAGSSDRLVDVAVVDASGQEYAGDDRGAAQAETLARIPAGRVDVHVGTCSRPAVVRTNETVVVRFDAADCIG